VERLLDLTELLDSVQAQTQRSIETIIVADGSPELAHGIADYIQDKAYRGIQVLYNEGPLGLSEARNMAIRQAKGDIIAFIDDDAVLFSDWAEEMVKTYEEDNSVIGVTGPVLPVWQEESMAWFPKEFYWIISCTHQEMIEKTEVRNGHNSNMSFRREAFEFDELFMTSIGVSVWEQGRYQELTSEEPELSLRVKHKTHKRIIYNPKVRVSHKVHKYQTSLRFIVNRAYSEGYAKAILKHRHRSSDVEGCVLYTEKVLLRCILFWLVPQAIKRLFRQYHPERLESLMQRIPCQRCGRCCDSTFFPQVALYPGEGEAIARHIGRAIEDFFNEYCLESNSQWYLKQSCPFLLKDRGLISCTIYEVRPGACRLFPLYLEEKSRTRVLHRSCPARRELSQFLMAEQPLAAVQQLWLTTLVLSCAAGGYIKGELSHLFKLG